MVHSATNDPERGCLNGKICTSVHAEIGCVRKAKNPLKFKLIVIRVSMNGEQTLKNSLPCKYCRDYLLHIGFRTIYCSTDNGEIVKVKLKELPDHESAAQKNVKQKLKRQF